MNFVTISLLVKHFFVTPYPHVYINLYKMDMVCFIKAIFPPFLKYTCDFLSLKILIIWLSNWQSSRWEVWWEQKHENKNKIKSCYDITIQKNYAPCQLTTKMIIIGWIFVENKVTFLYVCWTTIKKILQFYVKKLLMVNQWN